MAFFLSSVLVFFGIEGMNAQALHLDKGGIFYLSSGTKFTTSSTLVTLHDDHIDHNDTEFVVKAGFNWENASEKEYVDGYVSVLRNGETILHVGDRGFYRPITVNTSQENDKFKIAYRRSDVERFFNSIDFVDNESYDLSDTEYWNLKKQEGSVSDGVKVVNHNLLYPDPNATYNGNMQDVPILANYITDKSLWDKYKDDDLFSEYLVFAQLALIPEEEEEDNPIDFYVYPSPVDQNRGYARVRVPKSLSVVDIEIYDIFGSRIFRKLGVRDRQKISIEKLPKGLLFVRGHVVGKSHNTLERKFIVE